VSQREVYPHAPIVLVAVEVRHSLCEPLDPRGLSKLSKQVAAWLPLRGEVQHVSMAFQAGASGNPVQQQVGAFPRWSSRDKRTAVTARSDALVIESTNYQQYERLREIVEVALDARMASIGAAGVERVGLRYIDEIRVPLSDGESSTNWAEWVHPSLLGPGVGSELVAEMKLAEHQGLAVFAGDKDRVLALRYGTREGYATASSPELRRPTPPPGPFFLLDIDSFWQPSEEVPEMETESVLQSVDALHTPVRLLFEGLITEKLREEVLRGN
jgi:uncharacterized protein (TIGR04255 family)